MRQIKNAKIFQFFRIHWTRLDHLSHRTHFQVPDHPSFQILIILSLLDHIKLIFEVNKSIKQTNKLN